MHSYTMSDSEEDAFAAFGSDSESEGEGKSTVVDGGYPAFANAADASILHITTSFLSRRKTTALSDRYIAVLGTSRSGTSSCTNFRTIITDRLAARGVKVLTTLENLKENDYDCSATKASEDERDSTGAIVDAAVLFQSTRDDMKSGDFDDEANGVASVKRGLVPGGLMLLCLINNDTASSLVDNSNGSEAATVKRVLDIWKGNSFDPAVWDIENASVINSKQISDSEVIVISISKRCCTVNTASCPWKDLSSAVPQDISHFQDETWLMHERSIASQATVTRTSSEVLAYHRNKKVPQPLSEESIRSATRALNQFGFVVLKNVFDAQSQTLPWGEAVLSDFETATQILKERDGVDILNPGIDGNDPLNYREMAMREDLRVDLRDGPAIQTKRCSDNKEAYLDLRMRNLDANEDDGPTIISSSVEGSSVGSMRFNSSILSIVRSVFNPHAEKDMNEGDGKIKLYSGNFGRWNFGGSGPDGTPQPLRVGQVGSVLSLPGSADQAIHADTPHLFEHIDCLPCHYANLFTPGAALEKEVDSDGNMTGRMDSGGTAFVYGSHRLSVTAEMTAEQPNTAAVAKDTSVFSAASSVANERAMHVRIVRPSLQLGDALIFDCRVLHFGLANCSRTDTQDTAYHHVGRRPMLYINYTHSWFHDPKNWDMRKKIF